MSRGVFKVDHSCPIVGTRMVGWCSSDAVLFIVGDLVFFYHLLAASHNRSTFFMYSYLTYSFCVSVANCSNQDIARILHLVSLAHINIKRNISNNQFFSKMANLRQICRQRKIWLNTSAFKMEQPRLLKINIYPWI